MLRLRQHFKRVRAVNSVYAKIIVQGEDAMESLRFSGGDKDANVATQVR
jgi:hypothetical protein